MTTDIFAQFAEVPDYAPREDDAGVYLLLHRGRVVYVGSSSDVPYRVDFHARSRVDSKKFDRALWIRLPVAVLPAYEGALIRAFKPKHNLTAPASEEHDAEILAGLGLDSLTTEGWREHLRAMREQKRHREGMGNA